MNVLEHRYKTNDTDSSTLSTGPDGVMTVDAIVVKGATRVRVKLGDETLTPGDGHTAIEPRTVQRSQCSIDFDGVGSVELCGTWEKK